MTASRAFTETALRVGIVLLTLATALIRLQLAFPDPAFILNGLGYLTLLAALYLPIPRGSRYHNSAVDSHRIHRANELSLGSVGGAYPDRGTSTRLSKSC